MGRAFHKSDAAHAEQSAMDRALEKRPPQIEWQRRAGGVYVAVKVIDPHAESGGAPRTLCLRGHKFTPENTIVWPDGTRHCRECKRASDREAGARKRARKKAPECTNESLLAAARTEI